MTQQTALKKLQSKKNIFLTGKAGTGKTFVLNQYIKECEENGLVVLKTAQTGIASLNLNGITLHVGFNIPIPAYGHKDIILSKIPKTTRDADIIIIDEISMCRADIFEYVFECLELIKKSGKTQQLIVCGDFFQLPPVVPLDEAKKLKRFGIDPSGFAFLSPAWKKCKFVFCELDKVYRTNDKELLENLNKMRIGDKSCIPYFNQKVIKEENFDQYSNDYMVICSTNAEVDRINDLHLSRIEGGRYAYGSTRKGKTAKEYSVDDTIFIKPHSRIIFMANDDKTVKTKNGKIMKLNRFQNGTIGEAIQCFDKTVVCKVGENEFELEPYEWTTEKITISNGLVKKTAIGTFSQLPIKLAYAITMHKTQGQTYDKCVVQPNSFTDGQLYVALSRITNGDGLILLNEIKPEFIKTNAYVLKFYKNKGNIEIPLWIIKKKEELAKKKIKKTTTKKVTGKATTKKVSTKKITNKVTDKVSTNKVTSKKTAKKVITKKAAAKKNNK
jgi:hypothetical protein